MFCIREYQLPISELGMGPLLAALSIISHQISHSIVNMQIRFIHNWMTMAVVIVVWQKPVIMGSRWVIMGIEDP